MDAKEIIESNIEEEKDNITSIEDELRSITRKEDNLYLTRNALKKVQLEGINKLRLAEQSSEKSKNIGTDGLIKLSMFLIADLIIGLVILGLSPAILLPLTGAAFGTSIAIEAGSRLYYKAKIANIKKDNTAIAEEIASVESELKEVISQAIDLTNKKSIADGNVEYIEKLKTLAGKINRLQELESSTSFKLSIEIPETEQQIVVTDDPIEEETSELDEQPIEEEVRRKL